MTLQCFFGNLFIDLIRGRILSKFDVEKTVNYWYEGAQYDLDVLVVKTTQQHAPYTHSLPLLAEKSGIKIPKRTTKRLARFMEFHFEARYPDEQKKFYKKCTKVFATKKMKEIREVYEWLKKKLEKK